MPVKYECDRCNKEAVAKVTIKRETPRGTPTNNDEIWVCIDHLHQLNAAIADGGRRT